MYQVPTFNLPVNLWHAGNVPPAAPDLVTVGNLTPGRRTNTPYVLAPAGTVEPGNMHLLVPAGTDIRDAKGGTGNDLAEVPAGSGRFYDVVFVDDIGSGFINEHRFGMLAGAGPWPTPFPAGTPGIPLAGGTSCVFAAVAGSFSLGITYKVTSPTIGQKWFQLTGPYPMNPAPFTITTTYGGLAVPFRPGFFINQGPCGSQVLIGFQIGALPSVSFASLVLDPNLIYVVLGIAGDFLAHDLTMLMTSP